MNVKAAALAAVVLLAAAGIAAAALSGPRGGGAGFEADVDLEVFGNADGDSKITEADALLIDAYVAAAAAGDAERADELGRGMSIEFADANRDGRVDSADSAQVRGLLDGTAEEIWLLDGAGDEARVCLGAKRIGCEYFANTELCLILGIADRVAAVDYAPGMCMGFYFPERQGDVESMGNCSAPDYDRLNALDLDVLLVFKADNEYQVKKEKLVGADVLYLGLYNPDIIDESKSRFVQGVLKAGYVFGAVDRAEAYVEWLLGYRDGMLEASRSVERRPVVCMSNYTASQYFGSERDAERNTLSVYLESDPLGQACALAGGLNVADLIADGDVMKRTQYSVTVGIDALLNDDEDVHVDHFFLHCVKYTYGGTEQKSSPAHGLWVDDPSEMEAALAKARDHALLKDEEVHLVAGDFRNGCTGGVLLAAYIGTAINPEEYAAFDPGSMTEEYVNGWLGIGGWDADANGVLVCPRAAERGRCARSEGARRTPTGRGSAGVTRVRPSTSWRSPPRPSRPWRTR